MVQYASMIVESLAAWRPGGPARWFRANRTWDLCGWALCGALQAGTGCQGPKHGRTEGSRSHVSCFLCSVQYYIGPGSFNHSYAFSFFFGVVPKGSKHRPAWFIMGLDSSWTCSIHFPFSWKPSRTNLPFGWLMWPVQTCVSAFFWQVFQGKKLPNNEQRLWSSNQGSPFAWKGRTTNKWVVRKFGSTSLSAPEIKLTNVNQLSTKLCKTKGTFWLPFGNLINSLRTDPWLYNLVPVVAMLDCQGIHPY